MKTYIYISGFVTAFLFLGWLLAYLLGMPNHLLMLTAGSMMLVLIYLPLVIRKRNMHKKRMSEIIQNYQEQRKSESDAGQQTPAGQEPSGSGSEDGRKGWSMNNSPFRERGSGVTWGGGNIHAANATRNSRKRRK